MLGDVPRIVLNNLENGIKEEMDKTLKQKNCNYFKWDSDWYYCASQDKEIYPNECKNCKDKVIILILSAVPEPGS